MDDNDRQSVKEAELKEQEPKAEASSGGGGGGWGGWGFSSSIFTELQKAAEEISRNAAEVAKSAAKSISEIQDGDENTESKEEKSEGSDSEDENDEKHQLKKSALDKLEKAGEDSILGQGLKVIDDSVENFASGAWQALGNAWRGGTDLVQKLESSAVNLAESIQQGVPTAAGSVAPSLLETGKAFTTKGIQVLEFVGKETMDLLIAETGIDIEKNSKGSKGKPEDDQLLEEMTFDRCFYIYGGPEQLEELEALSSHYALLFNRRKAKLSAEEKSLYDGKLKEVQQIFDMSFGVDGNNSDLDKGKKIEGASANNDNEMKDLHDSSVKKAASMAAGFASTISGLAATEMIQKTGGRLEALHSEGVHRLSEMCCFAVSQLLMLGKSVMSSNNKGKDDEDGDAMKIDWPEDSVDKAKLIRSKAQLMTENVEAISNSFITGISDVAEAYMAAIKGVAADSNEAQRPSILEKVKTFSEHLRSDQITAVGKVQDGLQYLPYLVLSSSMAAA